MDRRGYPILWNWSYRCVNFHWVVGTGPDPSAREVNVLYCQGISLAPWVIILNKSSSNIVYLHA